ncbi:MAG: zinc-ribbon domain containing protein [Pirellulales bacterium]
MDSGFPVTLVSMACAVVALVVWAVLFLTYWGTTLWEKLFPIPSRSSVARLLKELNEDPFLMTSTLDFDSFVDHPRYGKRPQVTGMNPKTDFREVYLHRHSRGSRVANTAIPADFDRQTPATVAVTHYFDAIRRCVDCQRQFIFFAEEQKYWYEELGFNLHADCTRCVPCRRRKRSVERLRRQYERLFHVQDRSIDQDLEMADICLTLVERGAFHRRQTEHVRMLLNRAAARGEAAYDSRRQELLTRVRRMEAGESGPDQPSEKV